MLQFGSGNHRVNTRCNRISSFGGDKRQMQSTSQPQSPNERVEWYWFWWRQKGFHRDAAEADERVRTAPLVCLGYCGAEQQEASKCQIWTVTQSQVLPITRIGEQQRQSIWEQYLWECKNLIFSIENSHQLRGFVKCLMPIAMRKQDEVKHDS